MCIRDLCIRDLYAQDELLSEVNQYERKGIGADIYLANWNPARGTWDNIQVVQPGVGNYQVQTYDGWNDPWNISRGGMVP